MPFIKVELGDQMSQPMVIKEVYDDFLKCEMNCYDSSAADGKGTKIVDVSRPDSLRRDEYEFCGARTCDGQSIRYNPDFEAIENRDWQYVSPNTKQARKDVMLADVEVKKDGIVYIMPPYEEGNTIYVTKNVGESICQPCFDREAMMENTTVEIFIDENRDGRSWEISGGGISGYEPKCITFCEDGVEVTGQILFKTGCPDTPEGQGEVPGDPGNIINVGGATGPEGGATGPEGETGGETGPTVDELLISVNKDFACNDCFSFNPIQGPTQGWTTIDQNDLAAQAQDGSLGQTLITLQIPAGATRVTNTNNGVTIVRPAVGQNIVALGGNTFEPTPVGIVYPCSNLGTDHDFLCGSYAIGIQGDGTATGVVTSHNWLAPHSSCTIPFL